MSFFKSCPSLIAIAVASLWTTTAVGQLTASDRAAVDAYRAAIASVETGSTPRAVESAFAAVASLRESLTRAKNGGTVLESLSEDDFTRLARSLRGVVLNREEVIIVEPDVEYFARLAGRRGDDADRAFFSAFKATYPTSVWPSYIEQQVDYAGCTRFGSLSLIDAYGAWTAFQHTHPRRYPAAAKREVDAVLNQLSSSTCACGDSASVERELQGFLRRFPTSSVRAAIDLRLRAVRAGRTDIRMNCVAG